MNLCGHIRRRTRVMRSILPARAVGNLDRYGRLHAVQAGEQIGGVGRRHSASSIGEAVSGPARGERHRRMPFVPHVMAVEAIKRLDARPVGRPNRVVRLTHGTLESSPLDAWAGAPVFLEQPIGPGRHRMTIAAAEAAEACFFLHRGQSD
jgi:hypothetical protein